MSKFFASMTLHLVSATCHQAIWALHTSLELMRTPDEKKSIEEAEYAGSHST